MITDLPIYCARGGYRHDAAYDVQGPTRGEVVCLAHLEAARRWVGISAHVTPLQGHDPPPEQPALF